MEPIVINIIPLSIALFIYIAVHWWFYKFIKGMIAEEKYREDRRQEEIEEWGSETFTSKEKS